MAKQEEIKKGIRQVLLNAGLSKAKAESTLESILIFEDLLGVVLKVDRDIPLEGLWMPGGWFVPKVACEALMDLAVEPLI